MPTSISLYPKTKKPKWVSQGVKCRCLGEGSKVFIIAQVEKNRVWLEADGIGHGWESLTKISKVEKP